MTPSVHATHLLDTCIEPDPVCDGTGQPLDIVAAAANDGLPGRPLPELQQAVIVVEADKCRGWVRQHFGRRSRPDRARHRQQMIVAKGIPILAFYQIIAEADLFVVDEFGIERRLPIEADKIREHRPEAGTDQVAGLSEQPRQAASGVFELATVH